MQYRQTMCVRDFIPPAACLRYHPRSSIIVYARKQQSFPYWEIFLPAIILQYVFLYVNRIIANI